MRVPVFIWRKPRGSIRPIYIGPDFRRAKSVGRSVAIGRRDFAVSFSSSEIERRRRGGRRRRLVEIEATMMNRGEREKAEKLERNGYASAARAEKPQRNPRLGKTEGVADG